MNGTVRSELLQITLLCCALLIFGVIFWQRESVNSRAESQGIEVLSSARFSVASSESAYGKAESALDSLFGANANVREIASDEEFRPTVDKAGMIYLVSCQSCYLTLSSNLEGANSLATLLKGRMELDVIVKAYRSNLRRELLLYKKMHQPVFDIHYWIEDLDDLSPGLGLVAVVKNGELVEYVTSEDVAALKDGKWPFKF